ncbi:MAG: RnfH family protein [Pseudoxanthomonas sp.]|nr:RnfH family protein [Pseudoxanthomonas sp.]
MKIELIIAWPGKYQQMKLEMPAGSTVSDALHAAGWAGREDVSGYAVFGINAALGRVLEDGDRVELLRPLQLDPMQARRRRAAARQR